MELERSDGRWDAVLGVVALSRFDQVRAEILPILGPDETAYFQRLTHRRRQESFLMGRLAAKVAVAGLAGGCGPEQIEIRRGVFEQPLVRGAAVEGCSVSVSHDAVWGVALAFRDAHPMAVDVETVGLDPVRVRTIESQLSERELGWVRAEGMDAALLATVLWTAKEAVSKAVGCGLTAPVSWMNLKKFQPLDSGRWRGEFEGFLQYQSLSWTIGRTAISVVLPRNSTLRPVGEVAALFELQSHP